MTLLAAALLAGVAQAEPTLPIRGVEEIDLVSSRAWVRHAGVARTGGRLVLTGGIVAAAVPLGVLGVCLADDLGNTCTVFLLGGAVAETVAGVTLVTGEFLMFGGGIAAAYDGQKLGYDTKPHLGWVGLGLFTAGTVAVFAATAIPDNGGPYVAVAGIGGIIGGTVLGYLQLGQIDMHNLSVTIVPRPNGFALAGRF